MHEGDLRSLCDYWLLLLLISAPCRSDVCTLRDMSTHIRRPSAKDIITPGHRPISAANEKPNAGTNTKTLSSGHVADIVVGSIVGLLFLIFLGCVGRRKLTAIFGKNRLAVKGTSLFDGNETLHQTTPGVGYATQGEYDIGGRMYLGVELEADGAEQEMNSYEDVEFELADSNLQISELPSSLTVTGEFASTVHMID